ncbi:MAG: T9SS type A sorting domain-containing protein, partial [Bacteroidales bacterium]|nr:T9SS type A sorting domain-containing protein [Bacteroidales bacterium]
NGSLTLSGIVIGNYNLEVSLAGFDLWQVQDISISSDTIIPVQLIETIVIPSNLNANQIDNLGNVMLSWNGIETREFVSFKVYLDNNEVGTTSDTAFVLETLSNGNYQAGLQSVYTSGESEIITKDFVVQGVGLNDNGIQQLMIYPVPAKDYVSIEYNKNILSIKMIDLNGQIVYQELDFLKMRCNIPLQEIKQGMYIVQITTEQGFISRLITVVK